MALGNKNYFNSDEFLKVVARVAKTSQAKDKEGDIINIYGFVLDAALFYIKLNGKDGIQNFDSKEVTQFLTKMVDTLGIKAEDFDFLGNIEQKELYVVDYVLNDFAEKNPDVSDNLEEVVIGKMVNNLYKYHATNGANVDSIMKNGLDPNRTFEFGEDMKKINKMFESHGDSLDHFGAKFGVHGNEVFYSETPQVSLRYANTSPEWLDQFTGCYFIKRDYEGAKENIKSECEDKNLSASEQKQVLEFFEKAWKKYAEQKPYLIVVQPEEKYTTDDYIRKEIDYFKKSKRSLSYELETWVGGLNNDGINISSKTKIDTSKAVCFVLPELASLEKRVTALNETRIEKLTDQDILDAGLEIPGSKKVIEKHEPSPSKKDKESASTGEKQD